MRIENMFVKGYVHVGSTGKTKGEDNLTAN